MTRDELTILLTLAVVAGLFVAAMLRPAIDRFHRRLDANHERHVVRMERHDHLRMWSTILDHIARNPPQLTVRNPVTKSPNMPSRIELRRWAIEQATKNGAHGADLIREAERILSFAQPEEATKPSLAERIYNGEPAWTPPPGGAAQASPGWTPSPDAHITGRMDASMGATPAIPTFTIPGDEEKIEAYARRHPDAVATVEIRTSEAPTAPAPPRSAVTQQIAEELDKTFWGRPHCRALTEEIVDFVRSRIGKRNVELGEKLSSLEAEYAEMADLYSERGKERDQMRAERDQLNMSCKAWAAKAETLEMRVAEQAKQLATLRRDIVEMTKAKETAERYFDEESKNASIHYARTVVLLRERNAAEDQIAELCNIARYARENGFDPAASLRVMERALEIFKDKVAKREEVAQASRANALGDSDHAHAQPHATAGRDPRQVPR